MLGLRDRSLEVEVKENGSGGDSRSSEMWTGRKSHPRQWRGSSTASCSELGMTRQTGYHQAFLCLLVGPQDTSTDRSRESSRGSGWGHCLECSSASWSELKTTESQISVSRLSLEVRPSGTAPPYRSWARRTVEKLAWRRGHGSGPGSWRGNIAGRPISTTRSVLECPVSSLKAPPLSDRAWRLRR